MIEVTERSVVEEEVATSMVPRVRSKMNRLLHEKVPKAEVARQLGVSRQTVYNWLKSADRQEVTARRPSKLDDHRSYIESRLEQFDIPATVLLKELRERGYRGGITILRESAATIKDRQVTRLVDRFETEPGRQAQVDWASCGHVAHHGQRRRLSLLTVVLGHSRYTWARFVVSERRPVLMELLEQCFREVGAVPKELLFDNLKQVVAAPRSVSSPAEIQTSFAKFADHWDFETVACPPYWPRAKGKVERSIQYVKRSFLEGRSFVDLADLNAQLRLWLATVANARVHGTTKQRPCDRLAADLAAMLPLGTTPAYPNALVATRLADHDARISYKGVVYSVDPDVVTRRRGTPVEVHESADNRLLAFHRGRQVADHRLMPAGSPPQDDPLHALKRRQKRQLPAWTRPAGKAPSFDQRPEPSCSLAGLVPPEVGHHPLAVYEEAPCRPN